MPPTVAIITRAKNETPHVRRALKALARQTFTAFDHFAVDSGSTDGTLEALEASGARLTRIAPEDYVPGPVLNAAIDRAHHEIVVLLNADAVPLSADWLDKLLQPILENRADATFSRQVARADARFIVAYDYERAFDPANIVPDFFSAVACAFRRSLWETSPFPTAGYAEDAAWAKQHVGAGARFEFVPDAAVEHSHNYSLEALFAKRRRQALTFGETPNAGKQAARCLREIGRDLIHAVAKTRIQTVPYNLPYRVTIHRAVHQGLKER